MKVTLQKLMASAGLEGISVVAGKAGLSREVGWTNTIESPDLAEFARQNELIFMTGIEIRGDEEPLLLLIKRICDSGSAGLLINLGPYIAAVPQSAVDFAEANGFPLLTMPWNIRIADTAHSICEYIIKNADSAVSRPAASRPMVNRLAVNDILRRITLGGKPTAEERETLEADGFAGTPGHCAVVCRLSKEAGEEDRELIRQIVGHQFANEERLSAFFQAGSDIVFLFAERPGDDVDLDAEMGKVAQKIGAFHNGRRFFFGIGLFHEGLERLYRSFYEATAAVLSARYYSQTDRRCFSFAASGIYRLVADLGTGEKLKDFSSSVLGRLEEYDALNATNNMEFLRYCLEEDGSVSRVGKRLYLHRNTVMYRIKKIEDILGCDFSSMLDKASLTVALAVRDLEKLSPHVT